MDVIFCLPCFLRTAICLLDVKIQYINVYVFFFFFQFIFKVCMSSFLQLVLRCGSLCTGILSPVKLIESKIA